uniref:Uncharacterized protein n=1 Tax=Rhizophora mucronata TaxID=61149 RepID=A0A2P2MFE2_RHIMU
MLEVFSMLKNDVSVITTPKMPAFSGKGKGITGSASASHQQQEYYSENDPQSSQPEFR